MADTAEVTTVLQDMIEMAKRCHEFDKGRLSTEECEAQMRGIDTANRVVTQLEQSDG